MVDTRPAERHPGTPCLARPGREIGTPTLTRSALRRQHHRARLIQVATAATGQTAHRAHVPTPQLLVGAFRRDAEKYGDVLDGPVPRQVHDVVAVEDRVD